MRSTPWFLLGLFTLDVLTTLSSGTLPKEMFPHVDSEIWKRLEPLRAKVNDEQRQLLRAELKSLPDWENRLANMLVKIAVAARYDPSQKATDAQTEAYIVARKVAGPLSEVQKREFAGMATRELRGHASSAAMEMYYVVTAVTGLEDADVVRFTAPLLAERSEDFDEGDATVRSVKTCAGGGLSSLARKGVKLPGTPPQPFAGVDAWRQWWKENRQHYEPIPPALAALEASEGGTKPTPSPSTPVPATPTPAPATPSPTPEATPAPVASPSPVAQVPKAASKSVWPILACVGAAIVLIVLFARRSAKR